MVAVALTAACSGPQSDAAPTTPTTAATTRPPGSTTSSTTAAEAEPAVRVGAEVLAGGGFARLRGLRVGVVLNQASMVGGTPLLDLLDAADGVELVAAFAPEHGIRADEPAGETVADTVDPVTGVPVVSLYGQNRSPSPEILAGIDVLLFDLQDVGARFYTYISTMGLAMQAAAQAGVPFMVLDRPNPLGGTYVAGYRRLYAFESFVGQYPIPAAHGLTTGELAMAIRGESWLPGLEQLDLQVVLMENWHRADQWVDTGLTWYPPSPGLPTEAAAAVYPGTVLFEAASVSVGRGTPEPYSVVGAPWVDGDLLAQDLNERQLAGVHFDPVTFTPESTPAVPSPVLEGQPSNGVRVVVDDRTSFGPVETGVHLFQALWAQAAAAGVEGFVARPEMLDLLAGTDELRLAIESGAPASDVIAGWANDVASFERRRRPYLLYD